MADNRKFVSVKPTRISSSISATDTQVTVAELVDIDGNTLTITDFGTEGYGVFEPQTNNKRDIFKITAISGTTLTIERGGSAKAPYTFSGTGKSHSSNTRVILGTNVPQLLDTFANKFNEEFVENVWTFDEDTRPLLDADVDATDNKEFVSLGQLNRTALGTTLTNKVVVAGTAGETLVAGDFVYLDSADGEWKKTDASSAATSIDVPVGIAQGAGTDGNAITGGVLIFGKDGNQTGLTAGYQYLSDTAGEISNTAGTNERIVGFAEDATTFYLENRFSVEQLAGVNDDVSIEKLNDLASSTLQFGGDGSDGALSISSGTTTVDLSNESVVILNYTSISITGTGRLAFSNPNANGTLVIIKCKGDCEISSTAPGIDLEGVGAAGGAGGTGGPDSGSDYLGDDGNTPTAFLMEDSPSPNGKGAVDNNTNSVGGTALGNLWIYTTTDEDLTRRSTIIAPGAGGSGGNGSTSSGGSGAVVADGGDGGNGGGALILQVNGDLDFTGSISVNGEDGTASPNASDSVLDVRTGGGGGGGAAGMAIVLYNSATATSGSITAAGGAGGDSGDATVTGSSSGSQSGDPGRGGAGGAHLAGAGANGTAAASNAGAGAGGANGVAETGSSSTTSGGTGGASSSSATTLLAKNEYFY